MNARRVPWACLLALKNRLVMSPMTMNYATRDGLATDKLIRHYLERAKGGVGLIITSHAYVRPEGQASPWQIGIFKDELIVGLKEMTEAVHVACAIRGGASLVHGLQMMEHVTRSSM